MDNIATLIKTAHAKGIMIATAESCTGGMVAAAITDVAGSSAVFDRGFVTYSNEAKQEMLGVPEALIATYGAVSAEVASAMAEGALAHSRANLSVSITGIAGPTGGSEAKPVGTVYIASALRRAETMVQHHSFAGNRAEVREAATEAAINLLILMFNKN